ncbi:MAG: hypothetical protein ABSG78_12985 [Verrucomicrobiota bacterium]
MIAIKYRARSHCSDLDIGIELDPRSRPQNWDGRPESWKAETEKLVFEIEPQIRPMLGTIPIDVRFLYTDTYEPDFRSYLAKGRLIFQREQNAAGNCSSKSDTAI